MSQRTIAEVMKGLLELQIAQNECVLGVVQARALLQSWNDSMERGKHNRDEHRRYWDLDFALQCQKRYENEANAAEKKFAANQNRLMELKTELIALLPNGVFAR